MNIDKSYLSRITAKLCRENLITKIKSDGDKRTAKLRLSPSGVAQTEKLIKITDCVIEKQIKGLDVNELDELCKAFDTIISLIGKRE